jgi:hypothetical protein
LIHAPRPADHPAVQTAETAAETADTAAEADDVSTRTPVFVLAPARSYSTVSVALLSGHDGIYGFPEMLVFSVKTVGELLGAGELYHFRWWQVRLTGILRAVAEIHERDQSDPAIERARAWLEARENWSTIRFMDYLLDGVLPRTGLENSPETIASDESLSRCLRNYPRARFIHLTRHPVSTLRSLQEHSCASGEKIGHRERAEAAARQWYEGHLRIIRALSDLPPRHRLRIRAEDLLRRPHEWLPVILDWLGLRHDEPTVTAMLRTEEWPFAGTGPSGRLFGGDHKFMRAPELRAVPAPGPVAFPTDWGLRDETCRAMTDLAEHLGY